MLGIVFFLGEGNVDGPGEGCPLKNGAYAQIHTLMVWGKDWEIKLWATLPLGEGFSPPSGPTPDGFLGSNVFRNYVVEMTYGSKPGCARLLRSGQGLLVIPLRSAVWPAPQFHLGIDDEYTDCPRGRLWARAGQQSTGVFLC